MAEICKERLALKRKEMLKTMILADQLDVRDPQCIADHAQDVYNSMIAMEEKYLVDPSYLK